MLKKEVWKASFLLTATCIGAGILAMPYAIAKSGYLFGLLNIILIGLAMLALNLIVGEISLRTKGTHEVIGYIKKYLGNNIGELMLVLFTLSIYGALIAYFIGISLSLQAIFHSSQVIYLTIIFVIFSILLFHGIKIVKNSEIILGLTLIILLVIISLFAFSKINIENLKFINPQNLFYPYGIILFSFLSTTAIPEMRKVLENDRKKLRTSIIIGTLIPFFVYIIFTLIVLGVTGLSTTDIATIGLGNVLGSKILVITNVFAIISMAGAFLVLGLALKWTLQYDFGLNHNFALLLTVLIPFLIAISNLTTFTKVISFTGAIFGSFKAILLIITYYRAKKLGDRKPEYELSKGHLLTTILLVIFILGIIHHLFIR